MPNPDPIDKQLDSDEPIRHPLSEILWRCREPAWVADCAIRGVTTAWDLVSPSEFSSLFRTVRAHTMCSNARLRALFRSVNYVIQNRIAGDFVECGCARGGSAALIALTQKRLGENRALWLFDTFEGLPAPTLQDPDYEIANLFTGSCSGSLERVEGLFQRFQIGEVVHLVKGLFQDTLPRAQFQEIALLHIDGDWYESVKVCLENLYDKVVPGGVIQFDDYGYWQGARKAVDEFMAARGITRPLRKLDYSGRSLLKPGNAATPAAPRRLTEETEETERISPAAQ